MPYIHQMGPKGPAKRFMYRGMICELLGFNAATADSITFEIKPAYPEQEGFDPVRLIEFLPRDDMFSMIVAFVYDCTIQNLKVCTDIDESDDSTHTYIHCTVCGTSDILKAYNKHGLFCTTIGTIYRPLTAMSVVPLHMHFPALHTEDGIKDVYLKGAISSYLERPIFDKACAHKIAPWGATFAVNFTNYEEDDYDSDVSLRHPAIAGEVFNRIIRAANAMEERLSAELDPLHMMNIRYKRSYICSSSDTLSREVTFHVVYMPQYFGDYEVIDITSNYMIFRPMTDGWIDINAYAGLDWPDAKTRIERLAMALFSDMGTLYAPKVADREIMYYEDRRYLRVAFEPGFIGFAEDILLFSDLGPIEQWGQRHQHAGLIFHDGTQFAYPLSPPDDPEILVYGRVPIMPKRPGISTLRPVLDTICTKDIYLQVVHVSSHWIYFSINTRVEDDPHFTSNDKVFPHLLPQANNPEGKDTESSLLALIDMCFKLNPSAEFFSTVCDPNDFKRVRQGTMVLGEAIFNAWSKVVRLYERFDPILIECVLESCIEHAGGVTSTGVPSKDDAPEKKPTERAQKQEFIQTMKQQRALAADQHAKAASREAIAEERDAKKAQVAALQKSSEELQKSKEAAIRRQQHPPTLADRLKNLFKP